MASLSTGPDGPVLSRMPRSTSRKKTSEACERCREKRTKCNGVQPCDQCQKKDAQCYFVRSAPSTEPQSEALAEKLDLVLARLDRIEQHMFHGPPIVGLHVRGPTNRLASTERLPNGLAQLNHQTQCLEYYGGTSPFVTASSLVKRIRQMEETAEPTSSNKRRRVDHGSITSRLHPQASRSLGLDDLTGFCDYVVSPDAQRHDRSLRENIADRHLDCFFHTIHVYIPLFNQATFRTRYAGLRALFGDRRLFSPTADDPDRPQFVCLLYAVLALGALYEDNREDSSLWASWYFAEAQDMLGRHLEATSLQLVQAALLLGAYAQHALKPNLAYILTGTATRLAFSIGLHMESIHDSLPFDDEEVRRTYWMLYVQEVELSLDSGRPMTLPTSQVDVKYPAEPSKHESPHPSPATFIRHLADIAKIIQRVLQLVNNPQEKPNSIDSDELEELRQDLLCWRTSLPLYLQYQETPHQDKDSSNSLYSWQMRQQGSLRIHFNLAITILLRSSLRKSRPALSEYSNGSLTAFHRSYCLDAARDMIRHIHNLFSLAPSLRRWSYYCFYCLQATLVILTEIADHHYHLRRRHREGDFSPSVQERRVKAEVEDDQKLCGLAVEIFERIELKASRRCAEVVRQFLTRWGDPKPERIPVTTEVIQARDIQPQDHAERQHYFPTPAADVAPTPVAFQAPQTSCPTFEGVSDDTSATGDISQDIHTPRGSLDGSDDTVITVMSLSPSGLHDELFGAFYSIDSDETTRLYPFISDDSHTGASSSDADWVRFGDFRHL